MSDLVAFLKARLDEDEAAARAGSRRVGMPWRVDPEPWDGDTGIVDDFGRVGSTGGRYAADHIALHDPARVLREVEAKRAIVAEHGPSRSDASRCRVCTAIADGGATRFRAPCPTLRQLAAVYSDHPDYDPAW